MPRAMPLKKGERYGRFTVLGEYKDNNNGKYIKEKCICDCGTIKWVGRNSLKSGRIKSCGCLNKEKKAERFIKLHTTHGMAHTRIYRIYRLMIDRCINTNNNCYHRYGGRGIKCLRNDFESFYKDMGESYNEHIKIYGEQNTTIDRINNNGDYCKQNCRRATWQEQRNNKSSNLIIEYGGYKDSLANICRKYNKNYKRVKARVENGRDIKDAIEKPKGYHIKHRTRKKD